MELLQLFKELNCPYICLVAKHVARVKTYTDNPSIIFSWRDSCTRWSKEGALPNFCRADVEEGMIVVCRARRRLVRMLCQSK